EKNFKCLHAGDGETGLEFALRYKPSAIILDINLPGIEGWGVLEALKDNSATRHIPVHMMSVEDETIDAFRKGAIGYLTKPVTQEDLDKAFSRIEDMIAKEIKEVLIVEDDENTQKGIMKLLGSDEINQTVVSLGKEAVQKVQSGSYDCMILDLSLPDISGFDVLDELSRSDSAATPPVIVYTGKELTRDEEAELQKYTGSIVIKGVRSEERLLDETALFLHRVVDKLPARKKTMISKLHEGDSLFKGKKILIVDDDVRNTFAISKILQEKGMEVCKAANGQKALESLEKTSDIDLVLMDIMMPVMDGYEAMKRIREQERFRNLPVLALTAKAMKDDRERCIAAGANDYLPKPVDIDRLLSLMRVWLYK
ncbi:MAG: response regulator, partial [bacterium]